MSLGIGDHCLYPFSFILPKTIPSSYEGKYGHVRYTITATMERPCEKDHHCTMSFIVNSLVDLNQNPSAKVQKFKFKRDINISIYNEYRITDGKGRY